VLTWCLGTALLIAAFVTRNTLTLYHYHIIYDITNFTAYVEPLTQFLNQTDQPPRSRSISFCAALVHISSSGTNRAERYVRATLSVIFSILHLAFSIIFGRALERWDWAIAGRCYNTWLIAHSGASHPYVDRIYLAITSVYMQAALVNCFQHWTLSVSGRRSGIPEFVIIPALLQYPVHLYSTVALRISNENLLGGDSENNWGFGQVFALVLVADTMIKAGTAYYSVCRPEIGKGRDEEGLQLGDTRESGLSPS
jgi:hypothetical protein